MNNQQNNQIPKNQNNPNGNQSQNPGFDSLANIANNSAQNAPETNSNNSQKNQSSQQKTSSQNNENKIISEALLHVYHKDAQSTLATQKANFSKVVRMHLGVEEESKHKSSIKKPSSTFAFTQAMIMSLLFIVLGLIAIFIGNSVRYTKQSTTHFQAPNTGVILADKTDKLDISGLSAFAIKQLLANVSLQYQPPGTISRLQLLDKTATGYYPISFKEFVEKLKLSLGMPENTFGNYVVGVYHGQRYNSPFLIVDVHNYSPALSAFKMWEKNMQTDLHPWFPFKTGALDRFDPDLRFVDTVISNSHVRALVDKNNDPKLLYGFVNQDTIVLTNSTQAYMEIFRRLQLSK